MSKKSPQLRFEGFTDDWELRKLGDEVKINGRIGFRGYTQADIVTKETGVLAYSPTNIVNNRLYRKRSDTYITKQKYRESPEIMVKNSDILFVKTGSTLGKSALVQSINYHATVNPQIVIIRSNELDEYFLSVILTSYNILKRINTIKIGGAIPTMTETELKKFPIQVPKSTEQKKIGSFFKQLDNTIALHQRKLDLLKEQKKGYLQKMFPKNGSKIPELSFNGFSGDWEERKLLDNVDKVLDYRGKSPTKFGMEWGTEGYLVLSALNVKNGYIDKSVEAKYGDQELFERWMGSNRLEKGDVLFTTEAPLGNVAQVPDDKGYILNQRAVAFKSSKDTDNNFFAQLLRSPIVQNTLNANSSGGTAKGIGMKEFAKLNAHVPKTFEEQQKIGSFFKQLDNTIALHQRKLDLLKEQKKGFLQKMFV